MATTQAGSTCCWMMCRFKVKFLMSSFLMSPGLDRYYSVESTKEEAKNANMRHLVWERVPGATGKGKSRCAKPSYGVVAADSITKWVRICPHFHMWTQGAPENFLLNAVLASWPNSCSLSYPQPQQQQQQQQQCQIEDLEQQQQQQQPVKRLRTCS
ncbi:hypothetical protein ABBQ32_008865 [Trebouxia sp. C0010 RCD-2024]